MKVLLYKGIGSFVISYKALNCLGITTQLGQKIEDKSGMFFLYVEDFYPEKYKKLKKIKDEDYFYKQLNQLEIQMRADDKVIECWKNLEDDFAYKKECMKILNL